MKSLTKWMALGVIAAFVFAGCAKQPTQDIEAAKAAVDVVVKEGADVYAKDELKKLNDDLTVATDEVTAQDKKFFKKFGKAKEMLAQVVADADAVKALVPARKEEAKNSALAAQSEARAALDEAKALLEKAPKGKGTKKDIEALTADLKGYEDLFPEIQAAIDNQDYFGAKDKALAIKEKAAAVSEQVKAAIEKVKG